MGTKAVVHTVKAAKVVTAGGRQHRRHIQVKAKTKAMDTTAVKAKTKAMDTAVKAKTKAMDTAVKAAKVVTAGGRQHRRHIHTVKAARTKAVVHMFKAAKVVTAGGRQHHLFQMHQPILLLCVAMTN